MRIIADLHIHSRFSRGCSNDLTIPNLEKWAKIKGLGLLGTGDFCHPEWQEELKKYLKEDGTGILKTKDGFPFVLQNEISLIYTHKYKGRRVHLVVLAPGFEIVDKITKYLLTKGRVNYDGRPIFNIPCPEFVEAMMKISKDIEIIPAHCLLPGTYVHTNPHIRKIDEIKKDEKVLTHKGRFMKVLKTYKRPYKGKICKIIPWYFREGLVTTSEHPFYVIKSFKNCSWIKGVCKPLCSQKDYCKRKLFKKYSPTWIQAKHLQKGDFIVYPRINKTVNKDKVKIAQIIQIPKTLKKSGRLKHVKDNVGINEEFCRLVGYYLAEGYLISNEAVGFSFNKKEKEYIKDVVCLMKSVFGIEPTKFDKRKGMDIIFYSHILNCFFKRLFYSGKEKRAWTKSIPKFMLFLPRKKQSELLRGWWRGDAGYTVSHNLASQMKIICLRLGIIPSIGIDSANNFNERGEHFIGDRRISTTRDTFVFSNLSFFGDNELLKDNCFKKFVTKMNRKHGWIDDDNIYLPIRKVEVMNYEGEVYNLEVEKDNSYVPEFATVHNCWTPWFSLFGSKSGFDSVEECFGNTSKYIHALETGLSSDPEMNWRLSRLDKYHLVSFSDSHSYWPWRIGREATVFELKALTYANLIKALRTDEGLTETIEVDPNYGKYHFDGHRNCGISFSPEESKKHNNICPVCKRPLTIGVLNRVEQLADRKQGFKPAKFKPFRRLIPLHELLSHLLRSGMATKKVWAKYYEILKAGKNEFDILLNISKEELLKVADEKIVDVIMKNREGRLEIKPGFDGEYGVPLLGDEEVVNSVRNKSVPVSGKAQTGLKDFF